MSQFVPLNPRLFNLLEQRFGEVKVANEGVPFMYHEVQDLTLPAGRRLDVETRGEAYRIRCPYCGDTRHRLWICHRYGTPDPISGWPMYFLATCFNTQGTAAHCPRVHRDELAKRIFEFYNRGQRPPEMEIRRVPPVNRELRLQEWPGQITSMRDLSLDHHAYRYLVDRGFDPISLAEKWGVGYCEYSSRYGSLMNRIFAPIFFHNTFVGWQGRWPVDYTKEQWKQLRLAKYYTLPGLEKSRLLYNFDQAKHWPFIVVCEGITDVWKVGPYAVALLGKSVGWMQKQLLLTASQPDKPILFMLDADAMDASEEALRRLQDEKTKKGAQGGMLIYVAPGEHDPGYYSPQANWNMLCAAAAGYGVNLEAMVRSHG